MPAFIPLLYAGGAQLVRHAAMKAGKKAVVKFGKDVVMKNIHRYTGPAARRKMFDTFMKTSEKVAGSKPAQTLSKNLEKVNPNIRKIAPEGAPTTSPMEQGLTKTVVKVLRGRALRSGSQKIQAIKDQLKEGTISENEANKAMKKINREAKMLEKSKNNPWM
tara:strand:+ start:191 stop:676 length:486 start_codon:yes stop_codon:yes gene_type:complete